MVRAGEKSEVAEASVCWRVAEQLFDLSKCNEVIAED